METWVEFFLDPVQQAIQRGLGPQLAEPGPELLDSWGLWKNGQGCSAEAWLGWAEGVLTAPPESPQGRSTRGWETHALEPIQEQPCLVGTFLPLTSPCSRRGAA